MDDDNDGTIQIATLPDATDVHITELEPPPAIKTTLTKTQTTSNTGETTWTVHCSIGNEAGNIPDSLGQHRRTRKRKGPAGRFHLAGHIYAIPSALQPH